MQKRNGGLVPSEETIEPYGPIVEGSSRSLPEGDTGDQWRSPHPGYRQERSGEVPPATELRDPPGQTSQKSRRGLGLGRFFSRDTSEQELAERIARQSAETLMSGIEEGEVPTHYDTLSNVDPETGEFTIVTINYGPQEIYEGYLVAKKLSRQDGTFNPEMVQVIEEAYRVLSDINTKRAYDAELRTTGRDRPRTFEDLPGKYKKQFRKKGKTQARAARDIYAQATALGLDLYKTTSGGFDTDSMGYRPSRYGGSPGKRKKTVAELRLEIAEYEGKVTGQSGSATRPGKTKIQNQSDGRAGEFLKKVSTLQKKSGKTPLGKRISSGTTGDTSRRIKVATKAQVGTNLLEQTVGFANKLRTTERLVGNLNQIPTTPKRRQEQIDINLRRKAF